VPLRLFVVVVLRCLLIWTFVTVVRLPLRLFVRLLRDAFCGTRVWITLRYPFDFTLRVCWLRLFLTFPFLPRTLCRYRVPGFVLLLLRLLRWSLAFPSWRGYVPAVDSFHFTYVGLQVTFCGYYFTVRCTLHVLTLPRTRTFLRFPHIQPFCRFDYRLPNVGITYIC